MVAGNNNLMMPEVPMDEVVTDPAMAPGEEPIDFGRILESMPGMLVRFPLHFPCCLLRRDFPLCELTCCRIPTSLNCPWI